MKIWMKISIFGFFLSFIVIQIVIQIGKPKIEEEILKIHGEKLITIASAAASIISADYYKSIDFTNQSMVEDEKYLMIREQMRKLKSDLNLKEEIYTLNLLLNNEAAIFGIMTNPVPFAGDTLHLVSNTARESLQLVYKTGKSTYTNIYDDQYGMWLSGLAPITDQNGNVLGVVQADHEASFLYGKFDEINDYIFYFELALIPALILISIMLSKIISNPVTKVTEIIQSIALGNYSVRKNIKATGELKTLVESTDRMRNTIVEQQEKIFETINELKDINKQLEMAKEKVDSSDRLKSEFLQLISHEIRTPVNVIVNYLELIKDEIHDKMDDEIESYFDIINDENMRLIRTIDLIVTMAELQNDSYEKSETNFDVVKTVNKVVSRYENSAKRKGLDLKYHSEVNSQFILGDDYTIEHVFNNIIDNAIKFTPAGKIDVSVIETHDRLVVKISDTGIGISKDFQSKMFDLFSQEEQGSDRKFEGNGLGLALVKKACELNNVQLDFNSIKDNGTVFEIRFEKITESVST